MNRMRTKFGPLLLALALLIAACAPVEKANDPAAAFTAAAQTLDAQLQIVQAEAALQTAEAGKATVQAQRDELATQNAQLQIEGTQTAAAQATLSAIEPQLISPSGTLCRSGPNLGFARVAVIGAGDALKVLGRSTDGEWWQIESPEEEGESCWVFWDDDLDFLGEVFNLPFIEGPVLPTRAAGPTSPPGFTVRYVQQNVCDGQNYAVVAVRNTGTETYESAVVELVDVATGTQLARSDGNNEFLATSSSCPKGNSALGPGGEAFMAVRLQGASAGDSLRVNVRLCTENGMGGSCRVSNTTFTFN